MSTHLKTSLAAPELGLSQGHLKRQMEEKVVPLKKGSTITSAQLRTAQFSGTLRLSALSFTVGACSAAQLIKLLQMLASVKRT